MQETIEFQRTVANLTQSFKRIPNLAATTAVNFFKDRFRAQNWIDDRTEPWPKRKAIRWGKKNNARGRALLVQSGRLRRSIRKISAGPNGVVIGTDVPYAQVHNDGFRGEVKQTVKAYTRKRTKLGIVRRKENKRSTRISFGRVQTGESEVKEHTRTIRQNIPRRRFMGQSAALNRNLERVITAEFVKAIKQ